jgi:hypothetical protein
MVPNSGELTAFLPPPCPPPRSSSLLPQDEREAALEQFKLALRDGIEVLVYPHGGGGPNYADLKMDRHNKRLVWELETGRFGEFSPYPLLSFDGN